jgi:hypothetical protein
MDTGRLARKRARNHGQNWQDGFLMWFKKSTYDDLLYYVS